MNEKNDAILTISQHLARTLITAGHITTVDETIDAIDKFVAALQVTCSGLEASEEGDDSQNPSAFA